MKKTRKVKKSTYLERRLIWALPESNAGAGWEPQGGRGRRHEEASLDLDNPLVASRMQEFTGRLFDN